MRDRIETAYRIVRDELLRERTPAGHWVGELASSALSTATAVTALHLLNADKYASLITAGLDWLTRHQNDDGSWGDTIRSKGNISTTMLGRAAFHVVGRGNASAVQRAEAWLFPRFGSTPAELAQAVRRRYGTDRTFSVPILTMSALANLIDWQEVPHLPFELAALPQALFRFLRLPVVSYALPALIAIGQCVYRKRGSGNPLRRLSVALTSARSLRVLRAIQPASGGYLEATPLTGFVLMSLVAIDAGTSDTAHACARFLVESVRPDGSWPIDTNLSIWVTTLSVNALAAADDLDCLDRRDELIAWLKGQQLQERHPYTGAAPGGWGWSDLSGSVPDCDDTPGAWLALYALHAKEPSFRIEDRNFLRNLQNRDGGWPTFCRGWTKLPFDRSGSDLTAHALRALARDARRRGLRRSPTHDPALRRGLRYLERTQRRDGSWLPLWFGNEHAPDDENPTYGTSRVLAAYRDLGLVAASACRAGVAYLLRTQNHDGGWGGAEGTPSSVEETALAVEVLLDTAPPEGREAVRAGLHFLCRAIADGRHRVPTPIGLYFAKLWYFEKLYPLVWSVAACGRARRHFCTADPP